MVQVRAKRELPPGNLLGWAREIKEKTGRGMRAVNAAETRRADCTGPGSNFPKFARREFTRR